MSFDTVDGDGSSFEDRSAESVEFLLFDSLCHHLIEKGLLTKNDTLSVIQTVALVIQGRLDAGHGPWAKDDLAKLERVYGSFQALPDRHGRPGVDGENVVPLRPPLHGERPQFPIDDNN